MVLVIGKALIRESRRQEAIEVSFEHVQRARQGEGCLMHSVNVDVENPNRLVFVEYWQDRQSLLRHFEKPESIEFSKHIRGLVTEPPTIEIFDGESWNPFKA